MKPWTLANTLLDRAASFLADPFLLGIRLYWGWQFFQTGKGKLSDISAPTAFFTELGIPFPQLNAYMAGGTECFGGLLLLLGLVSRVTCVPLICVMLVAYGTAHLDVVKTIWSDSDSFVTAPPFLFLLAVLTVFIFGPGKFSVDALLRRRGKS
ncbi:DoxX family protein [Prosthecobacter sp.]|uniref:DoxX family protein n=1 Tax=Prosthecobacter sp. TaxID=1965333 RepID=UPI00248854E4|nr:DoxX family protein [Prosthecobacter sp.]MDI1311504.1 DoxX family protein [Prosthecobacter sp.]